MNIKKGGRWNYMFSSYYSTAFDWLCQSWNPDDTMKWRFLCLKAGLKTSRRYSFWRYCLAVIARRVCCVSVKSWQSCCCWLHYNALIPGQKAKQVFGALTLMLTDLDPVQPSNQQHDCQLVIITPLCAVSSETVSACWTTTEGVAMLCCRVWKWVWSRGRSLFWEGPDHLPVSFLLLLVRMSHLKISSQDEVGRLLY